MLPLVKANLNKVHQEHRQEITIEIHVNIRLCPLIDSLKRFLKKTFGILVSTISTTVVVSSVSIGSQNGAPCISYTTINDPTRNANKTGIYTTCDNGPLFNASNGGSWIRFVGTGGTIISLTSPGEYHCGGYLSGWFNGTLPTTVGTLVNGTVCFEIYPHLCWWSIRMSVINCGGFYVYFLSSVPGCNARYCTA